MNKKQLERLEKCNTTAGKLAECMQIIGELNKKIEQAEHTIGIIIESESLLIKKNNHLTTQINKIKEVVND